MNGWLCFSVTLFVFVVGCLICMCVEDIDWNNGYCSTCGKHWKLFDIDRQRGDGYTCTHCNIFIWQSWRKRR